MRIKHSNYQIINASFNHPQQCPPPSPLSRASKSSPKIHPKIAFPNCFFIRNFFASENCFSEKQYYNCILGTLKKLKKRINTCLNFFSKNLFPIFILLQSFPFEIKNFSIIFLKIFLRPHSSLTMQ